jgi:hypothetical protein
MVQEQIEKYIGANKRKKAVVNIHFKDRPVVKGVFVEANDYTELKQKNLWRIVTQANATTWQKDQDINLTRIFNGISFTRLSED